MYTLKSAAASLAVAISVSFTSAAFGETPRLLARLGFDEGAGAFADDTSGAGISAALSPTAKWVRGTFGTALATGENGACARLEPIAGLDGSDACSLAIRFRKNSPGYGAHPAVVTTTGWGNGGVMFYSNGKELAVRLRSTNGKEARFVALGTIPEKKWISLVMTFTRPEVKVYVNGELTASGKWEYPVSVKGAFIVGGWTSDSFGGFIDDFRVYDAALDGAAVSEYASAPGYEELEGYQEDDTGGVQKTELLDQGGKTALVLKGAKASMEFNNLGVVTSIRETVSGRELVSNTVSFATVTLTNGKVRQPRRMEKRGANRLAFIFPHGNGEAVFSYKPFDGGWTFTLESFTANDWKSFSFCRIKPNCRKWVGTFVNAWSDELSAVCVRSYGLYGNPQAQNCLSVDVSAPFPAVGLSVGIAAGPREGFTRQLQAMTIAAGVPQSDCGGAWSIGSEQSRRSYVFSEVVGGDVDYWIDFVKRGGFSLIHLRSSWTDCLGPYTVNRRAFPGGLDEMKSVAEKVHAAGLQIGMHTLTACINPRADWIHPVCSSNLVADATYTLAAPLAPDSKELVVEEMPIPKHSTVFTYSSNGNAMRLGGEIIQYTGIRREKPYAFTGLKRGAFGTRRNAGTVPAGAKIDYLHQRYYAFYPSPDSDLADNLADRLAEVYNTCGMDEFYFDGSEGMGTRYGVDTMRHKIYSRLKPNNGHSPLIEASCQNANNWWFQTRTATTDHGVWGVKRFHDWHIEWGVNLGRNANFLEPQMGWWQPRLDVPRARGHFLDDMEYFAAKNAGHDAAMSIQGVVSRPLPVGLRRQLTVLGWYEHARLGRCFTPEVQAYLAAPETESRLRQNEKGVWELTKVESMVHRAGHEWEREWKQTSASSCRAALRVEALYRAAPESDGVPVLSSSDFAGIKTGSASGVKVSFDPKVADSGHGAAFRLSAANASAPENGAWARAHYTFAFPGLDLGEKRIAFGVWVKGDGSGALLNLQFTTPHEFIGGISEHYVRLDFTGWKYVTVFLRERDAASYCRYRWPYGGGYAAIYRNFVDPRHIGTVAAYLNGIPAGKSATVEIGEIKALEQVEETSRQLAVVLNGRRLAVPFDLVSGEYAELEKDGWTRYSVRGDKLAVVPADELPALKAGENAVSFESESGARAEVTLFALGETVEAFVEELTADMRKELRYEGMMPFEYSPAKGFAAPKVIPVRPGEKASLSVEITGPCEKPSFTFGSFLGLFDTVCEFDAALAADELLVCRDGENWKVIKATGGEALREGRLQKPLPRLGSSASFTFSANVPDDAVCVVDVMKEY